MLAVDNFPECPHRIFHLDVLAGFTGKSFRYVERLGQKPLHLAGPLHGQLILVGELFHTQNGNNVLQFFVFLKHLPELHARCDSALHR